MGRAGEKRDGAGLSDSGNAEGRRGAGQNAKTNTAWDEIWERIKDKTPEELDPGFRPKGTGREYNAENEYGVGREMEKEKGQNAGGA